MSRELTIVHLENKENVWRTTKISTSILSRSDRSLVCCAWTLFVSSLIWWNQNYMFNEVYASQLDTSESSVAISWSLRPSRCTSKDMTLECPISLFDFDQLVPAWSLASEKAVRYEFHCEILGPSQFIRCEVRPLLDDISSFTVENQDFWTTPDISDPGL
jgi:hypothetical protein